MPQVGTRRDVDWMVYSAVRWERSSIWDEGRELRLGSIGPDAKLYPPTPSNAVSGLEALHRANPHFTAKRVPRMAIKSWEACPRTSTTLVTLPSRPTFGEPHALGA